MLQGNPRARAELSDFFSRADSWSLGLCNGCQLLAALGVVPGLRPRLPLDNNHEDVASASASGVTLAENESGRFESRFVTVGIQPGSPSVLLRGMENAVLGVWSAHGEGRFAFENAEVSQSLLGLIDGILHTHPPGYPRPG